MWNQELDLEETVSPVCDAPGSPMHKGAPQHTRALCCVGGGADYALGATAISEAAGQALGALRENTDVAFC